MVPHCIHRLTPLSFSLSLSSLSFLLVFLFSSLAHSFDGPVNVAAALLRSYLSVGLGFLSLFHELCGDRCRHLIMNDARAIAKGNDENSNPKPILASRMKCDTEQRPPPPMNLPADCTCPEERKGRRRPRPLVAAGCNETATADGYWQQHDQ